MKGLFTALLASSVLLLSACSKDDDSKVKVAINTGPDEAIWQVVKQVAKDKYKLDVEVLNFNDYVLPNEALNNKEVDANAFQSLPYLESQSNLSSTIRVPERINAAFGIGWVCQGNDVWAGSESRITVSSGSPVG